MAELVLQINNSYCELSGNISQEVYATIKCVLTYQNDIQAEKNVLFGKLQYFKRIGNKQKYHATVAEIKKLESSEWVCWLDGNKFPTGHLNIVKDVLTSIKANFVERDHRDKPKSYLILPWANKPFTPRYYQKEMINLGETLGRGVFESAVGTGKSLVMGYLIKSFSVNSLIVVPSTGLLDQLYNDLECWFGYKNVQMIDSAKVRSGIQLKPIRIITIQSLAALQKSGDLNLLISDVDALFLDEFHHAGSASYTNLLPEINHIYYRFGFTGTFLRNDNKSLDMWGFLSNKLYSYPAWKAIKEGFLTPIKIITYNINGKRSPSYKKEYDNNYCGGQELIFKLIEICQSYNTQILILVNKKDKAGKIFHEILKSYGIENTYISGDDKKEYRTDIIKKFNNKEIRILIGSSVIGEGIDVRSTDHLIMCQGGKSEIICVQAVGRAVRLYEGKTFASVHEFKFLGTKYMERHYNNRVDIYDRNFQPEFIEAT